MGMGGVFTGWVQHLRNGRLLPCVATAVCAFGASMVSRISGLAVAGSPASVEGDFGDALAIEEREGKEKIMTPLYVISGSANVLAGELVRDRVRPLNFFRAALSMSPFWAGHELSTHASKPTPHLLSRYSRS